MIIYCQKTPLVFEPLSQLFQKLNYQPESHTDKRIMRLLHPFDIVKSTAILDSHLTDRQEKEGQLRFTGAKYLDVLLLHFAREINKRYDTDIEFVFTPGYEPHPQLMLFIKFYSYFRKNGCRLTWAESLSKEDNYSSFYDLNSIKNEAGQNIDKVLELSKKCIRVKDYYSALNLLKMIEASGKSKTQNREFLIQISMCSRVLDRNFESFFYNEELSKVGDDKAFSLAKYSLAMLDLRKLPRPYRDFERAKRNLDEAFNVLSKANYLKSDVDLIFNRNGYALALFQEGKVEEAANIVSEGIDKLNKIEGEYAFFHKSVLLYNLFQCHKRLGNFEEAELTANELLKIDYQYHNYHVKLIEYYNSLNKTDRAKRACLSAIQMDDTFFGFHHLLGVVLQMRKEYDQAIHAYRTALSLNPFHFESLKCLCILLKEGNKYMELVTLIEDSNRIDLDEYQGSVLFNFYIVALLNLDSVNPQLVEKIQSEISNGNGKNGFSKKILEISQYARADRKEN